MDLINVLRIIDDMENLVETSKSLPLTKSRVVDYDAFFVLATQLKGALPEDIKKAEKLAREGQQMLSSARAEAQRTVADAQAEAQSILGDAKTRSERTSDESKTRADRTIEDARREAERIIADAQQRAEQLISEHEINVRAQEAARNVEEEATRESEQLRQQADDYAYDILDRAETVMRRLIEGIEEGKEQLNPYGSNSISSGGDYDASSYDYDDGNDEAVEENTPFEP